MSSSFLSGGMLADREKCQAMRLLAEPEAARAFLRERAEEYGLVGSELRLIGTKEGLAGTYLRFEQRVEKRGL